MLEELREQVSRANRQLVEEGLAFGTFGNASGVDRAGGHMVIKPSGVPHERLEPGSMLVVSLRTGEVVEGKLRPSSDTSTHLELYRAFAAVGGIVHTHSLHATAWAQAQREIPPLGTTHADFFRGPVPCTRLLKATEIHEDYEVNTGRVIVERFAELDPLEVPAVLVAHHGPFAWGASLAEAVQTAILLEEVARLAIQTLQVDREAQTIHRELLERHFLRKHGPEATYGQPAFAPEGLPRAGPSGGATAGKPAEGAPRRGVSDAIHRVEGPRSGVRRRPQAPAEGGGEGAGERGSGPT